MDSLVSILQETFPVGPFQCNCTVLGCPKTKEAIVIDPGDEVDRILLILAKHQLKVKAIVHTHAHIDHIGGVGRLQQVTHAPVYVHEKDMFLYNHADMQASFLGLKAPPILPVDRYLKEGEAISFGNLSGEVIETPGHTPGSVTFRVPVGGGPDRLFTGDTLFAGSIGRTDLWGGSLETLIRSIQGRLLNYPDEAHVFPGHGPETTIGYERRHNPFLQ